MRWKTTLILLTATIALGAYVSLYEIKQPSPEQREQKLKQILSLKEADIKGLRVTTPKADVQLRLENGQWIVLPDGWRADPGMVGEIVDRIPWLSAQRSLKSDAKAPIDLKAYGLEPPQGRLAVETEKPFTLLFGDTTPIGHRRYVQIEGQTDVHVVSTTLFEALNHPSEAFREVFLLPLRKAQPEEIVVESPTSTIALAAQAGIWQLNNPIEDLASQEAVSSLLQKLGNLPIQRYIGNLPEGQTLESLGLEPADTQWTLAGPSYSNELAVAFGKPLSDDGTLRYAKRSDDPKLYAVKADDMASVFPEAQSLRLQACFERLNASDRIAIAFEGAEWAIEQKDGVWMQAETEAVLDEQKTAAFLAQLSDLKITHFVEKLEIQAPAAYGLEPGEGRIRVSKADGQQQELVVGSLALEGLDGSKETTRYAHLVERGWIVHIPNAVESILKTKPDALIAQLPDPEYNASPETPAAQP